MADTKNDVTTVNLVSDHDSEKKINSLENSPNKIHSHSFSRKRKTKQPCQTCFLHQSLCICHLIPKLTLKTKISLVIHAKELKRTTNTGQLAIQSLTNSQLLIRGKQDSALDLTSLLTSEYQTFLFYPSDDAILLEPKMLSESKKPIQLIVPDGNWRQASKVHYRHHELKSIQRVSLKIPESNKNSSQLFMRNEIKTEGMATLEAIAYALGVIEGADIQEKLISLYQAKLRNTLIGRGQLVNQDIKK